MNTHIDSEEPAEMDSAVQAVGTETDRLAGCGFSTDEIAALLWLRQWYQTGGSDRVQIVRHLEFLKLLVLNGKLTLYVRVARPYSGLAREWRNWPCRSCYHTWWRDHQRVRTSPR